MYGSNLFLSSTRLFKRLKTEKPRNPVSRSLVTWWREVGVPAIILRRNGYKLTRRSPSGEGPQVAPIY